MLESTVIWKLVVTTWSIIFLLRIKKGLHCFLDDNGYVLDVKNESEVYRTKFEGILRASSREYILAYISAVSNT